MTIQEVLDPDIAGNSSALIRQQGVLRKVKVIKCERVDNPFYKGLVENPCIRTEKEFGTEKEANEFINSDIDEYIAKYDGNDIKAIKIEIEWQVGASIKDNSRFGGLNIYYQKQSW